ncbi:MAG: hypothetical protein II052_03175, partial [Prevotella sp.]|nr:hypothetical protein [Prevotella sp.]
MNQISPLAYIHPNAKLGDNNIIGPFCYIDSDVVIGDNNVFQNSVTLNNGCRLGSNNEVFPGASLSTKPQDLKFKGEITTCVIGDNNSIRENVTISRGTASKGSTNVGNNNLLMENMHIAHDCVVGMRTPVLFSALLALLCLHVNDNVSPDAAYTRALRRKA